MFVPVTQSVSEGEGTVQVCAFISHSIEVDINITLTTGDGTGMTVLLQLYT